MVNFASGQREVNLINLDFAIGYLNRLILPSHVTLGVGLAVAVASSPLLSRFSKRRQARTVMMHQHRNK